MLETIDSPMRMHQDVTFQMLADEIRKAALSKHDCAMITMLLTTAEDMRKTQTPESLYLLDYNVLTIRSEIAKRAKDLSDS